MRVGSFFFLGPVLLGPGLLAANADASVSSSIRVMPAVAGLLGAPRPPATVAPAAPVPKAPPAASPAADPPPPAPLTPAAILGAAPPIGAPPPARLRAVAAPQPPIAPRDLHARVSPAVVALVVSGGKAPPSVATGVLVTASGLALTSRRAIAESIEGGASVALVRGGLHGRIGAHEISEAVSTRLVAVSEDLDLALVEALPSTSIFYPHLPIARRPVAGGATVLAVGHDDKRGLWSGQTTIIDAHVGGSVGPSRWLRPLSGDGAAASPGTLLCDAVGRVVAMVVDIPATGGRAAVDADGLLRFLLAADAPNLRFAGVPPFRRPAPGAGRAGGARVHAATVPAGATVAGEGLVRAQATDTAMPGIAGKGLLDRRFSVRDPPAARPDGTMDAAARDKGKSRADVSFVAMSDALRIGPADLESHAVPSTVKIDAGDAPERGPRQAPVTIVELGDYHARETRDAEPAIRSLVDGADAYARLLWKDADRGDGADYHLAARAAHAASEQDEFWSMHDRLLTAARPANPKMVRQLARALDLDTQAFDASFNSDGLVGAIEGEGERAGRIPALCTPTFIVNGRVVDGGSVAGAALRAAVDDEMSSEPIKANAASKASLANGKPTAAAAAAAALPGRPDPLIAPGGPIPGTGFNATRLARSVAEATARRAGHSSGR